MEWKEQLELKQQLHDASEKNLYGMSAPGSVTVALGLWCKCLLHLCGYAAPVAFLPGLPVPALLLVSAWYSNTQAFKFNAWWKYIALPKLG